MEAQRTQRSVGTPDPAGWEGWTGHVIVCGLHAEGLRTIEQLHSAGVRVLVVDDHPDAALVRVTAARGVPLVAGDSRSPEVLQGVRLAQASAVICVESDDLHTLATALLVRELRTDVRVVVQLRNPAVGRALEATGVMVLDVARLSAPAVVEACLRSGVQALRLGREDFVVAETVVAFPGTLRSLFGDLAPVAVIDAASGHTELSPGRDRRVHAGDRVAVIGTPAEIEAAEAVVSDASRRASREPVFTGARAPRLVQQRRTTIVRTLLDALDARLRLVLLALCALAATSVTVLMLGYRDAKGGMTFVDAMYFTVETIGTVGFGDFYFRDQPTWLRLWAVLLMVVGAILATTFFALLTNMLVSRRIAETLGQRRLSGLADHVIVVGLGSIGVEVVERLREQGADVVVVEADDDNRFLARVRATGVPVVVADATQPQTLQSVQLERARAVAVLTSDDLANIETGLAVRDLLAGRWAAVPVVLRVFDRRLAGTLETTLDFRYVRSTAALAAPWFVGAALGLEVISTLYLGDLPVLVARLPVVGGGGLDGVAMRELPAQVRVVSLAPAGSDVAEHPPRRDTQLSAGAVAYLIGPYEELLTLLRRNRVHEPA